MYDTGDDMDNMIQSYMEETEELLQSAEACIIRLEMEYSSEDVNELFRIAHTIKGSSYMVGYEDVGSLMHKIEDLLDGVRNGAVSFEQSIVLLCFEGLDTVKKILGHKKKEGLPEEMEGLAHTAAQISQKADDFLRSCKKLEPEPVAEDEETGYVASLLKKKPQGRNKFFITFFIEDDAPMLSPVLLLVLNTVDEIGTLVYASVGDEYLSGTGELNPIKHFDIILSTNVEEAELYTYFGLFYIERINIVDLSRSKLEANDYFYANEEYSSYLIYMKALMLLYRMIMGLSNESGINKSDVQKLISLQAQAMNVFNKIKNQEALGNFIADFNFLYGQVAQIGEGQMSVDEQLCVVMQQQIEKLIERAHNYVKGKHLIRVFKSQKDGLIGRLNSFIGMLNKSSVFILLIDLSELVLLKEDEVKELIRIIRQLETQHMEIGLIVNGFRNRRIINILDAIGAVEELPVYKSETDAMLGLFGSQKCYQKINQRMRNI